MTRSPTRLKVRTASGVASEVPTGFGTLLSAVATRLSSALAVLVKDNSASASTGRQSFSQTAYWTEARSCTGSFGFFGTMRSGKMTFFV